MFRFALVAFALTLTGAAHAQSPPPPEPEDAMVLQIDVGRHAVFVDRAFEAIGADIPYVFPDDALQVEASDSPPAIWRNLRATARDAVIAKELYCARGLVGPRTCAKLKAPEWIRAAPAPAPSLEQLRAYEIALSAYMDPVVATACRRGRIKFKNDMYCSVE